MTILIKIFLGHFHQLGPLGRVRENLTAFQIFLFCFKLHERPCKIWAPYGGHSIEKMSRVRLAFSSRTARVKLTHVRFTLRSLGTGKVNGPTHICPTVSRSPAVAQITSPCVRFRQGSRSLARVRLAFSSRSARVFGRAQLAPVGSGSEGVSTEQSASFKIATCRQQVQGSCGCAVQESGVVGVKRRSSQTLCILSHFHVHTPWPACVDEHRPVVMEGNED